MTNEKDGFGQFRACLFFETSPIFGPSDIRLVPLLIVLGSPWNRSTTRVLVKKKASLVC